MVGTNNTEEIARKKSGVKRELTEEQKRRRLEERRRMARREATRQAAEGRSMHSQSSKTVNDEKTELTMRRQSDEKMATHRVPRRRTTETIVE